VSTDPVHFFEIRALAHGMDQVIGKVNPLDSGGERIRLERAALNHLDAVRQLRQLGPRPNQDAQSNRRIAGQPQQEAPANVAGGSGQQDVSHGLHLRRRLREHPAWHYTRHKSSHVESRVRI